MLLFGLLYLVYCTGDSVGVCCVLNYCCWLIDFCLLVRRFCLNCLWLLGWFRLLFACFVELVWCCLFGALLGAVVRFLFIRFVMFVVFSVLDTLV